MQFQRISPAELLIQGSVEDVREAAWYALRQARVNVPVIDAEKNIVVGSTGDGVLSAARTATAQLIPGEQGVSVLFQSKAVIGGTIDFGAGKKAAKSMASAMESVLSSGFTPSGTAQPQSPTGDVPPPIALATGGGESVPFVPTGDPVYGQMRAPKRGSTLMAYGVLSVICCPFLAPFAICYGIGALRDYNVKGDPGDRGLVIAGLCLGIVGCLVAVLRIALQVGLVQR